MSGESTTWAEKAKFTELLNCVKSLTPVRLQRLVDFCIEQHKFYKYVVLELERFCKKTKPKYRMNCIYILDHMLRKVGKHSKCGLVYKERLSSRLLDIFTSLLPVARSDEEKVLKVLNKWLEHSSADGALITSLQETFYQKMGYSDETFQNENADSVYQDNDTINNEDDDDEEARLEEQRLAVEYQRSLLQRRDGNVDENNNNNNNNNNTHYDEQQYNMNNTNNMNISHNNMNNNQYLEPNTSIPYMDNNLNYNYDTANSTNSMHVPYENHEANNQNMYHTATPSNTHPGYVVVGNAPTSHDNRVLVASTSIWVGFHSVNMHNRTLEHILKDMGVLFVQSKGTYAFLRVVGRTEATNVRNWLNTISFNERGDVVPGSTTSRWSKGRNIKHVQMQYGSTWLQPFEVDPNAPVEDLPLQEMQAILQNTR